MSDVAHVLGDNGLRRRRRFAQLLTDVRYASIATKSRHVDRASLNSGLSD